jgi:hypothetical protein
MLRQSSAVGPGRPVLRQPAAVPDERRTRRGAAPRRGHPSHCGRRPRLVPGHGRGVGRASPATSLACGRDRVPAGVRGGARCPWGDRGSSRSRRPRGARRWRRRPIVGGGWSPVRAGGPRPGLGGPRRNLHAAVPTDRCLTPWHESMPGWSRCPVGSISSRGGCRCSGRRPVSALRTGGRCRRPSWRSSPARSLSSRPIPSSPPAMHPGSRTASSTWTPGLLRSIRSSAGGAAGGSDLRGGPSGSRSG